ncbi:MAG: aspartate--ammonia ligase [Bacteroidales bacterium]|jgi:aspartate--ammonia ligase|nr:aspartate--ammonia ligase [Bacteroidales bacterium]
MSKLFLPESYVPLLNLKQTEKAIKQLKDFVESNLSAELQLRRVTAPLFVLKGTGLNDDLNGTERAVTFPIKDMGDARAEVVHSLAKWKRMMLAEYRIATGYGLYTDMNAIRSDEELDNLHSIYVDQWDWELAISNENRSLDYLKHVVEKIFNVLKRTEFYIYENYPELTPMLPDHITFVHSEELLAMYPDKTPKERENLIAKKHGTVFIIGIGSKLLNGEPHDGRAPDYDDWTTPTVNGYKGLNGDILLWNPILECAVEISSMGIRVDREAMLRQLTINHAEERTNLMFHQKLLNNDLPLSIGGGIGQSRLCMYFLRKAHIGETQASIWPKDMIDRCRKNNIILV